MKAFFRTTLGAGVLALGFLPGHAHALSTAAYDRLFAKADLNHDGFLSLDEFIASQPRGSRQVDLRWRFQYNDVNNDGYIDLIEFRASKGVRDGRRPSKAQAFDTADLDHDGFLDPSEYALTFPQTTPYKTVLKLFINRDRDEDSLLSRREYGILGGQ